MFCDVCWIVLDGVKMEEVNYTLSFNDLKDDTRWDFVRGYKSGMLAKNHPESDSEAAVFVLNGKLPFSVMVPETKDDKPFCLALYVDGFLGEMSFRKVVNLAQKQIAGMTMAIEDKYGELSYSLFSLRVLSSDGIENPLDRFIKENGEYSYELISSLATRFVKHFVNMYKAANYYESLKHIDTPTHHIYSKHWIPEIYPERLSPWTNIKVFSKTGQALNGIQVYDCRGTGLGLGSDLPDDILGILQDHCEKIYIPGIERYFDITNRHKSRGDYDAFCIFLMCTFEKWVFIFLDECLQKRGFSREDINEMKYKKIKRRDGSYQLIGWEDALKEILGSKNFKNSTQYKSFIRDVVRIRDEIIHGEVVVVIKEQADKMGVSFQSFQRYVLDQVV